MKKYLFKSNMKRRNIISTLACSIAALAFTACADVWEEHYQPNPELNADETLWERIEADPELSYFADFLRATGYDTLLTKDRCYTIWAPVNDAEFFKNNSVKEASRVQLDEYRKELVENHIADYSHVAGGKLTEDNLVKMLNGKYLRFENASGEFTFKGISLKESNVPAKNGVLHKINGYATFTANIWEQLAKEESLDSLYNFLFKDYKREPNWAASVQGPMVDGQIVYLDTVWSVSCPWFSSLGNLNREDSSYTMFALTNRAWDEMYEMAKPYFSYAENYADADSIQEAVVREYMCRNLVFSDKVNKRYANGNPEIPYDTLVSNYNLRYTYEPLVFGGDEVKSLYRGAKTLVLSNGTLNIVDEVNYNPLKCWHDTIRVEAENLKGGYGVDSPLNEYGESDYKSVVSIKKDSVLLYNSISNGAVGVFMNEKNDNPKLTFKLNNVLSACYKVKIVVVPPHILNPRDTSWIKPNKFLATLTCGNSKDKDATQQIALGRKDSCDKYQRYIYSDPTRIDTIELVPLTMVNDTTFMATGFDYVEIPVCEYQEESKLNGTLQTKLSIDSYLSNAELGFKETYKAAEAELVAAEQAYLDAEEAFAVVEEPYLLAREGYSEEELEKFDRSLDPIAEFGTDLRYRALIKVYREYQPAKIILDSAQKRLDDAKAILKTLKIQPLDNTLRIDQVILEPITPKN